jgi:hypothetical protein
MPPGTPFTNISANVLDISRGRIPMLAPPSDNFHSPSSRRFPRTTGFAVAKTEQNLKSP